MIFGLSTLVASLKLFLCFAGLLNADGNSFIDCIVDVSVYLVAPLVCSAASTLLLFAYVLSNVPQTPETTAATAPNVSPNEPVKYSDSVRLFQPIAFFKRQRIIFCQNLTAVNKI